MKQILPQIIWITIFLIGVGISLQKNGEPRTGKHSAASDLITSAVFIGLFYWGGWFDPIFNAFK